MAGSLDEGVVNLERFCGVLSQTSASLGESASAAESRADELDRLEDEGGQAFEELADALQDGLEAAEDAGGDALDALRQLADGARELAGSRLGTVQDQLAERGQSHTQALAADGDSLESSLSDLESGGFDPLADAVGGVQGGVDTAGSQAEDAFTGLEDALDDLRSRVEEAYSGAEEALAEAAAGVDEAAAELGQVGADCATTWQDELPAQLENAMEEAVDSAEGANEGFGGDAVSEGDELIEELGKEAAEAAEFLGGEQAGRLQEAADLCEQQIGEFESVLDAATAMLQSGAETARALDPMVGELETSERVVAEVDQLLNALGG